MSISIVGKQVTDGLIFVYDRYNNKSYVGEPTTNYQWSGGSEVTPWTVSGTNTDVTGTADQGPIKGAKTWKFVKTGTSNQWNGWESNYSGIWTGNSGDVWTTSYWYKTTAPAGITNFGVGSFFLPDWSRAYSGTILANVSSVIADGDWHYNYTTTQLNENYSNAIIVDGPSWGYSTAAGTLFINGLQWEKKSHPTPFAYGTRSNTQAVLDLASNASVDLTDMTFDANANFTFDGTNDYINTGVAARTLTNGTIEAWVYDTKNNSGYRSIVQFNVNSDDALYIYPANVLGFWPCAASSLTVPSNTWVHVAVSYNGSQLLYSVNGVMQTISTTCADFTDMQYIKVGGHSTVDGERWQGKIDMVRIYNRALSGDEILKNYNATKARYGR